MTTRIMSNLKNTTKVYSGIHNETGGGCMCGCRGKYYEAEGTTLNRAKMIVSMMTAHWAQCEIDGEYVTLTLPLANNKTRVYVAYTK